MSIEPIYNNGNRNGKVLAGLILLAVGGVLLLQQITPIFFPDWLISWGTFWIALGLYIGAKHNFRKPTAIIMIVIGCIIIGNDVIPGMRSHDIFWPVAIICFGIWMIMGRRQQWRRGHVSDGTDGNPFGKHNFTNPFDPKPDPSDPNYDPNAPAADRPFGSAVPPFMGDDHIDTVSVFGGVKRTILSKSFKGGEIVNIFGGTDLDLTQADINGHVIIEVTQLFGGIKLIIPPHWQVTSDVAAVFSSVDDKRRSMGTPLSADKVLVIKGVSIFAGVDIRSF